MRKWTCLKVTGASEEHRGERLAGDRSHLVTIETGRQHDNGSIGLVEDTHSGSGGMSTRVRVKKRCGWERGEAVDESYISVCFLNSPLWFPDIWIHLMTV